MKLAFVVKVSKLCNLRCTYCYEMPELHSRVRISDSDIEKMFVNIRAFLRRDADVTSHSVEFVWHGGEPFAQPISFWQTVLEIQRRIFSDGQTTWCKVQNVVQSNLTLITRRHLPLLRHFHLGFSFDVVNDLRVDAAGRSTSESVRAKVDWLISQGISLTGIAVISRANVTQPEAIAKYFLDRKLYFRALNIYQAKDSLPGAHDASLSFEEYLEFFQTLGSLSDVRQALEKRAQIEPLSTAKKLLANWKRKIQPSLSEQECIQREWILAVNTNGDVYSPGDCYNLQFRYGNIFSQSLEDVLFSSNGRQRRILRSQDRVREVCTNCFLYRTACDGTYVSHATPEEAREFRMHKSCYFGALAKWMLDTSSERNLAQGTTS
jgi:uncharacterized protein